jgi:hypothetical protein
LAPSLRVPGHRGATRIAPGFVEGRWDARFSVARGRASLRLPEGPLRARLWVAGPAAFTVRTAEAERTYSLKGEPTPVDVIVARGGRVDLLAHATVRLHEVLLTRLGPAPWGRLAVLVMATLAAAALAVALRGGWAVAASLALTAVAAGAVLRRQLGGLALAVGVDHSVPALALAALAALFLLPRWLPPGPASRPAPAPRLSLAFGLVALASCLAQVLLRPQPLVIGDPSAYYDIGQRFAAQIAGGRGPGHLADAVQALRPYGGLAATGILYGALLIAGERLAVIYVAHALAVGGAVFFLVRAAARIGGRRLALGVGLLAVVHPTFPILCGIVQPEPVILLLWTLALDLVSRAREEGSPRRFAQAGLCFGLGLALHPQGMWFLLAALVLVAVARAAVLVRAPVRHWMVAFAFGLLPVAVATAAGETWARPARQVLDERHGFWAYTARVPLGFWLYIDTDGWQGPLRIDETRYARGLREAEAGGARLGFLGRVAYTARFAIDNGASSARIVLRNLHRLLAFPDNPFRRDWILPHPLQVAGHRAVVVLFLLAIPLALAGRAAPIVVPVVLLAATYPLYHVFNKYAVPATPFLLLGAALALERLAFVEPRVVAFGVALLAAGLGAGLRPGELVLRGTPAEAAMVATEALYVGGTAAAFVLAVRHWAVDGAGRAAGALAGVLLLAACGAAAWGDARTRRIEVALDREVRHEIALDPESQARLFSAREAWLFLDLHLPDGFGSGLRLSFDGGAVIEGGDLRPTMPRYGLATLRGGRDPRVFPQWWAVPFRPDMLRDGRLGLGLKDATGRARLFGDLGTPPSVGVDPGLSLGQWPFTSVYRLMHDGEYRLATRQALGGSRKSAVAARALPGSLGVRLVILDTGPGGPPWAGGLSPRPWRPLAVY